MRIVNGKKFYQKEIEACHLIAADGWDHYNGRNMQWYRILYNPDCGLVVLKASNSGDCYGDYQDRYFISPRAFAEWADSVEREVGELLGDINEDDPIAMAFAKEIFS